MQLGLFGGALLSAVFRPKPKRHRLQVLLHGNLISRANTGASILTCSGFFSVAFSASSRAAPSLPVGTYMYTYIGIDVARENASLCLCFCFFGVARGAARAENCNALEVL